jgi:uncharacterized protein YggE
MVFVVLLMGLLAVPVGSWAHEDTESERTTLTVTGVGQLALAPDTVFVTLGMETAGKSLAEAERHNRAVMQRVTERLRELQIDNERIQTANFSVLPQYKPPPKRSVDGPSGPPEIIGYIVSNSVTVEVRHLEKVGAVIEESLASGANRFQGLHWGLRDEQQAKLVAVKQAAAKGREKAAALSESLNVKLIRLVSANESSHVVRPVSQLRATMAMESRDGELPIFAGELKVEATVTLIYEIGQE